MVVRAVLTADPISPGAVLQSFREACEDDGAIASFCGIARPTTTSGEAVSTLILERHPRLTDLSLQSIVSEGAARFDVSNVFVVHRWGAILPAEVIVFVAVSARHRRHALLAVDYLMDRLKTDAVFWKREEGIDARRWIEPTEEDRASLARWD